MMVDMNNIDKEKITIITGACGQLGTALAYSYAKEGFRICIADLIEKDLKLLIEKLNSISDVDHIFHLVDITSEESVEELIEHIENKGFVISTLINNAGTAIFSDFSYRKKDEFMKVAEVNLFGTFNCIRQVSEHMIENKMHGSIVNIGSIYGVVSSDSSIYTDCDRKNSEIYSASKAGVIQMTKYFAVHLAENNIRVNCVSPGGIFNDHGDDFLSNYSQRTPMKRMAEVNEIVSAIEYLSDSEKASYITGQNLIVDGGLTSW